VIGGSVVIAEAVASGQARSERVRHAWGLKAHRQGESIRNGSESGDPYCSVYPVDPESGAV
jgi:hypothetical protein